MFDLLQGGGEVEGGNALGVAHLSIAFMLGETVLKRNSDRKGRSGQLREGMEVCQQPRSSCDMLDLLAL
jgi:hypothetical protein